MELAESPEEELVELEGQDPVRLQYPLDDWIEGLLRKYPDELASIRPEGRPTWERCGQRSQKKQR